MRCLERSRRQISERRTEFLELTTSVLSHPVVYAPDRHSPVTRDGSSGFCSFSLRPISMILKSLQIRLQGPERQFCKGRVNARRFQPRDAALLFGDHRREAKREAAMIEIMTKILGKKAELIGPRGCGVQGPAARLRAQAAAQTG
jgi:hypothetical protein